MLCVVCVLLYGREAGISIANLRILAKTAIRSKLPPSSRKETAKSLLDMFIQLFVAEGELTESVDLLTQFLSHPVMAQEPSLAATLAVLSCLELIRFVHKAKPSVMLAMAEQLNGTTAFNKSNHKRGGSDHDRSSDSDSNSDSDSDSSDGNDEGGGRDDIPVLVPSRVTGALLCPSCEEIVENPLQFFSTVEILQQFSKIRTSRHIK